MDTKSNKGRTWLISDIHGDKKRFDELLNLFVDMDAENNRLIILGDVLDRGKQSIELMNEVRTLIKERPGRVAMIKGNHELFLEMYVEGTLSESTWRSVPFGGAPTLAALKKMSSEEISDLVSFIKALPIYMEIESPIFGATVLTHSGFDADVLVKNADGTINTIKSIEKGYANNPFRFLCSGDIHRIPTVGLDRFVIVGHTPCIFLEGGSYEIVQRKRYMCIDSGGAHRDRGGKLAMYCVEENMVVYA